MRWGWLIRLAPVVTLAVLSIACEKDAPPAWPAGGMPYTQESLLVARERVAQERVRDGVVEAAQQATLSAQTSGRVRELPVDVGDVVEAGQVVARLSNIEQGSGLRQAQAGLRAAEAMVAEARLHFDRVGKMVKDGLMSQAAYDQAQAGYDSAKAALDAARAAVREAGEQLEYTTVRSPYAGFVTERQVRIGEAVGQGQPLLSLLSLDTLRVHADIPQSEIEAVRTFSRAAVLLENGGRIEAERVIVFPQADARTHSVRVRLELPANQTGVRPGAIVKVAFAQGDTERLLAPVSALQQRGEVSAVYVIGPEGGVSLRQVRPGHRYGDRIEILAGLADGERIAADPVAARAWLAERRKGMKNG
jgi:RND family efflux transporter MFP subunit